MASETFQEFAGVTDTIRSHVGEAGLLAQEGADQYVSTHAIADVSWLKTDLRPLASSLIAVRFTLTLLVRVAGYSMDLQLDPPSVNGSISYLIKTVDDDSSPEATEQLSPEARQILIELAEIQKKARAEIELLNDLLQRVASSGVPISLSIRLFLDKTTVRNKLASSDPTQQNQKIITFLFLDALRRKLESTSLDEFEEEFFEEGKRTVICVFDSKATLESDLLAIVGRDKAQELDSYLYGPLPSPQLARVKKSLSLRGSQSFGTFSTRWLTPDSFDFTAAGSNEPNLDRLRKCFQKFQTLLAAIFLADSVEFRELTYWVEYRGLGKISLPLSDEALRACDSDWASLYALYSFAYDGFSADKLEVAQQFISLLATSLETLCSKAIEIRDATKKTYDKVLVERVKEYFEARQNIQTRIQTAISEISNDAIGLSRDVSSDLYKTIGVIALAVATTFFGKDLALSAVLLGFCAIGVYLIVVVTYHLPTLSQTVTLRKNQHRAYINSFGGILADEEIEGFLNDPNWNSAQLTFSSRHSIAQLIYILFMTSSLAAAECVAIVMLIIFWLPPEIPPIRLPLTP